MPRSFRDLVTQDAPNVFVNAVARDGNTMLSGVRFEVNGTIVQPGDKLYASFANLLAQLDDDGTPLLQVKGGTLDQKPGTIQLTRENGQTLPTTLLPGEVLALDAGRLLMGMSTGATKQIPNVDDLTSLESSINNGIGARLTNHINDKNNPHAVTTTQIGAATVTALNNHINNKNNPHGVTAAQAGAVATGTYNGHVTNYNNPHRVTAAQVGALSANGGTVNGNVIIQAPNSSTTPSITLRNSSGNTTAIHQGMGANDVSALYVSNGQQFEFRRTPGGPFISIGAAAFNVNSQQKAKKDINAISSDVVKKIYDIEVVDYHRKADNAYQVGVTVEQLNEVMPDIVHKDADGNPETYDQSSLTALLLAGLQDLNNRLKAVEDK